MESYRNIQFPRILAYLVSLEKYDIVHESPGRCKKSIDFPWLGFLIILPWNPIQEIKKLASFLRNIIEVYNPQECWLIFVVFWSQF
jgi:hypothetical protein